MSELTREQIEAWAARDQRIADIDRMVAIENDLRTPVIQALLASVQQEADAALQHLAGIHPLDLLGIVDAQKKVYMARFIAETISAFLRKGQMAEASLAETGIGDA